MTKRIINAQTKRVTFFNRFILSLLPMSQPVFIAVHVGAGTFFIYFKTMHFI